MVAVGAGGKQLALASSGLATQPSRPTAHPSKAVAFASSFFSSSIELSDEALSLALIWRLTRLAMSAARSGCGT